MPKVIKPSGAVARKHPRRLLVATIALLLASAVIIPISHLIQKKVEQHKYPVQKGPSVIVQKASESKDKDLRDVSAAARYDALRTGAPYDSQLAALQTKANQASAPHDKMLALVNMANLALKYAKYDDAKTYAQQAQTADASASDTYVVLAQVATAQNDPATAKAEWQAAIDHLDKNATDYQRTYDYYKTGVDAEVDS